MFYHGSKHEVYNLKPVCICNAGEEADAREILIWQISFARIKLHFRSSCQDKNVWNARIHLNILLAGSSLSDSTQLDTYFFCPSRDRNFMQWTMTSLCHFQCWREVRCLHHLAGSGIFYTVFVCGHSPLQS